MHGKKVPSRTRIPKEDENRRSPSRSKETRRMSESGEARTTDLNLAEGENGKQVSSKVSQFSRLRRSIVPRNPRKPKTAQKPKKRGRTPRNRLTHWETQTFLVISSLTRFAL